MDQIMQNTSSFIQGYIAQIKQSIDKGQYEAAVAICDKALAIEPENKILLMQKAFLLLGMGQAQAAYLSFSKMSEIPFYSKDSLYQYFSCLMAVNEFERLRQVTEDFLLQYSEDFSGHLFLAIALYEINHLQPRRGGLRQAMKHFKHAYHLDPTHFMLNAYIAAILYEKKHYRFAVKFGWVSVENNVQNIFGYMHLGKSLCHLKDYVQLKAMSERFVKHCPENFYANGFMAIALFELYKVSRDKKAIKNIFIYLKKSLRSQSDDVILLDKFAQLCIMHRHYHFAKKIYLNLIDKQSTLIMPYINVALLFLHEQDYLQSEMYFKKALQITPNDPDAHYLLGMTYLLQKKYQQGWAEYEWRRKLPSFKYSLNLFKRPYWSGENLADKTLLIVQEQGDGDFFQFLRFIPLIHKSGGKIIVVCRESVYDFMKDFQGVDDVFLMNEPLPDYDCFVFLLSLPFLLRIDALRVGIESPYCFATPEKIAEKSSLFLKHSSHYKIGLVWKGNPNNRLDFSRSMSLNDLKPLTELPDIQFFSLQKEITESERAFCQAHHIISLSESLEDYRDTAACIAQLDLILSVDTSVAHLAGAMGRPVWILLSTFPHWPFELSGTVNAWYPSMRSFRQTKEGDWGSLICGVRAALEKLSVL